MNLLPKSEVNFAKKDYWDTFFKNRNNKEFEWYVVTICKWSPAPGS